METAVDYTQMTIGEISKLSGVSSLTPMLVRGKFAMALRAEANGDHETAARLLDEAVVKEQEG